jgi:uncharacterized membrane protein
MERKWKIFLSYLFWWLSGLILLLVEKEDLEVKYHAAQSLIVFLGLEILSTALGILKPFVIGSGILIFLVDLISLVLWIYFLYGAITEKEIKLSFLKDFVEKLVK